MSFHDFWTNENNPSLPKSEYLYGTRHIIVLILTALMCVVFTLIFRKKSDKAKKILFYVFGIIFLIFEVLSRVVNLIITTDYSWQNIFKILVPMHICSVMVWVFIVAIFSQNKTLINFAITGGLLATVAFLAYPAVGLNRVHMSFTCFYSTFSHALGFVTVILLLTLGFADFKFKDIWKTYLCFTIMFLWGVLLDFVIFPGSDYMYIINDPLELNLNFPYQLLYGALLIVYVFVFYFVGWCKGKIKEKDKKHYKN